jgi:hypothetical protein
MSALLGYFLRTRLVDEASSQLAFFYEENYIFYYLAGRAGILKGSMGARNRGGRAVIVPTRQAT